MGWPGRKYNSAEYRYGFNGKEKDDEGEFGSITNYDYGFRIYNPAVGKFLSVDPLMRNYPMLTPYQFASNRPIDGIDIDGKEYLNYVVNWYEGQTKPEINISFYDIENHNHYGPKGPGILYTVNYWSKTSNGFNELNTERSNQIFYSRDESIKQYGFYYGSQGLFKINQESGVLTDTPDYDMEPIDAVDYGAWIHDQGYGAVGAKGASGLFMDLATTPADMTAIETWQSIADLGVGGMDPYNYLDINKKEHERAKSGVTGFTIITARKKNLIYNFISKQKGTIDGVAKNARNGGVDTNYKIFVDTYFEKDEGGLYKKRDGYWEVGNDGNPTPGGDPIPVKDVIKN